MTILELISGSILLGAGLAMDAFTVSVADGLQEPDMKRGEALRIAGTFAFFQFIMPLAGWLCVHTIAETFVLFQMLVPWIALLLLCWIGGGMLLEGIRGGQEEAEETGAIGTRDLIVQGVATSIDALSVGFAIEPYSLGEALAACLLIGLVTLAICLGGLKAGRGAGTYLAGKAPLVGGVILIGIGLEIFIRSFM